MKLSLDMRNMRHNLSWLALFLLLALSTVFIYFGGVTWLRFDNFRSYQTFIDIYVADHWWLSIFLYCLVYFLSVAAALPLTAAMDVLGGYLFGYLGFPLAMACLSFGALIPFWIVRTSAGTALSRRALPFVERVRIGFNRNAFSYLIGLRLVPWAPFAVTSVLAGMLKIRTMTFFLANVIGFLPWGFALNVLGHQMECLLTSDERLSYHIFKSTEFFIIMAVVIAGVMIPKLFKSRQTRTETMTKP